MKEKEVSYLPISPEKVIKIMIVTASVCSISTPILYFDMYSLFFSNDVITITHKLYKIIPSVNFNMVTLYVLLKFSLIPGKYFEELFQSLKA